MPDQLKQSIQAQIRETVRNPDAMASDDGLLGLIGRTSGPGAGNRSKYRKTTGCFLQFERSDLGADHALPYAFLMPVFNA
jgi:hypothetical protein